MAKVICIRDGGVITRENEEDCTPIAVVRLSDGSEATLHQLKIDWILDHSDIGAVNEKIKTGVREKDPVDAVAAGGANWIPRYKKWRNAVIAKMRPEILETPIE
jgi:hypothetical protein